MATSREKALERMMKFTKEPEPILNIDETITKGVESAKDYLTQDAENDIIGPALAAGLEVLDDIRTSKPPPGWKSAAAPSRPGSSPLLKKPTKGRADVEIEATGLDAFTKGREIQAQAKKTAQEQAKRRLELEDMLRQEEKARLKAKLEEKMAPEVKSGTKDVMEAVEQGRLRGAKDITEAGTATKFAERLKKTEAGRKEVMDIKQAVSDLKAEFAQGTPKAQQAAQRILDRYKRDPEYDIPDKYSKDPMQFVKDIKFNTETGRANPKPFKKVATKAGDK